jgi:hypothetical protein
LKESEESKIIQSSRIEMEDSDIINNEIQEMNINESSQMTEENFRVHTRRSPSEMQSKEQSHVFVNNQIHHHLISTINGIPDIYIHFEINKFRTRKATKDEEKKEDHDRNPRSR